MARQAQRPAHAAKQQQGHRQPTRVERGSERVGQAGYEGRQDRTAALKASIEAAAQALAEELSHGASDRLQALLTFSRRFHQYSFGNQILIASQYPDATHVAGYKTWQHMGYQVATGSKAIWILAPRSFTTTAAKVRCCRISTVVLPPSSFVCSVVFDAAQLTPESVAAKPLPAFYTDLGSDEDAHRLARTAKQAIRAEGIRIVQDTGHVLDPGVQGMSSGGTITIRAGLSDRNYMRTLTHEWAHEVLHHDPATRSETTRAQRECHAEATSYVVLAHFGLHNDLSSDYLTTWGTTPDGLLAELGMVQRAASHIIATLEAAETETEAAHEHATETAITSTAA